MSEPLLILFHPGTRGDFLAVLLLDKLEQNYKKYCLLFSDKNYIKLHQAVTADQQQFTQLTSIKINFTPHDLNLIMSLWRTKQLPYTPSNFHMQEDLTRWNLNYKPIDQKFKYIVKFADLFDIDFLADFYHCVTNKKMPNKYIPMIKYNIDLQLATNLYTI
jgi:hypothetical protein